MPKLADLIAPKLGNRRVGQLQEKKARIEGDVRHHLRTGRTVTHLSRGLRRVKAEIAALTAVLLLALGGCLGGPPLTEDTGVDGGADTKGLDTEPPCTSWACRIECTDGGCWCEQYCASHDPSLCPGPWPCK